MHATVIMQVSVIMHALGNGDPSATIAAVGLGGGQQEADDYEWVDLSDLPESTPPEALAGELCAALEREPVLAEAPGSRVLLVDLDNLRAGPLRWAARMAAVVRLAERSAAVALAGQAGPVERARPHLGPLAEQVVQVPDGADLADLELLAAAGRALAALDDAHVLVLSNDHVFAQLAERVPLVVASPGADALSDVLRDAAVRVLDLAELEAEAAERLAGRRSSRR